MKKLWSTISGCSYIHQIFSEPQLKMLLLDLFFAGSETTITTIRWGTLLLAQHPQIQARCRREIGDLLQRRRQPVKLGRKNTTDDEAEARNRIRLSDAAYLPYTQATIYVRKLHTVLG